MARPMKGRFVLVPHFFSTRVRLCRFIGRECESVNDAGTPRRAEFIELRADGHAGTVGFDVVYVVDDEAVDFDREVSPRGCWERS